MNPYMAASGNEAQISGSIEIDYIYGVGNRLLEMTTRSGSGREDITKFEYDPQGNLLKDGKARYTYDSFNRLQKAETFDGQVQINHYDGEGLRHEIEENGELVQFIYSDKEVVAETNTNGELTRYIRGLGLISADSEKARNYYHYCSDELGSITHILDEEGNTLNNYEYDAFGNTTLCKENVPNRFRYTGQQYDKVTEQYYLRARYYNPIIGRFLQEDSYYNDGLNLYAYGDNNPVRYIDPSGYTKVDAHDKLPGNQQASMDGLNNPQKKTWNEFQHTNKGKYTKAEMSQAWSDYKKSFDINTPKAEIPNNTPTQGNVGRSNKGGSQANQTLLLEAPKGTNPWMEGTEITSIEAPKDFYINMAMTTGQKNPGGWGTLDDIPDVNYVRNNLAVTPEFKAEVGEVQKYLVPQGTRVQVGTVGPQTYNGMLYPGTGNQVQLLNYSDRAKLIPIGGRKQIK